LTVQLFHSLEWSYDQEKHNSWRKQKLDLGGLSRRLRIQAKKASPGKQEHHGFKPTKSDDSTNLNEPTNGRIEFKSNLRASWNDTEPPYVPTVPEELISLAVRTKFLANVAAQSIAAVSIQI
jgi:hypothetical protein